MGSRKERGEERMDGLMEKYSSKWEQIDGDTQRLKTPQGWLVCFDWEGNKGYSCSLCFVPDPEHKWIFNNE